MQKPNLDRTWRMWIKIGIPHGTYLEWFNRVIGAIRRQVSEVITILEDKKIIDWYYFLIHKKKNDSNFHFDVVFSLREGIESRDFLGLLPNYCLKPKPANRDGFESISGIEKKLLKKEEVEEAWKIIGEQSKWIIRMVGVHKDVQIPINQFTHLCTIT